MGEFATRCIPQQRNGILTLCADLSHDRVTSIPNVSKKAAGYPMAGSCARGTLLRFSQKYSC